jgi:hypothetical protein
MTSTTVTEEASTTAEQTPSVTLSSNPAGKKLLNFDENGVPVYKVPTFPDKYAERKWAKEQVAGAFRVFSRLGYADGGAGHISLRGEWKHVKKAQQSGPGRSA